MKNFVVKQLLFLLLFISFFNLVSSKTLDPSLWVLPSVVVPSDSDMITINIYDQRTRYYEDVKLFLQKGFLERKDLIAKSNLELKEKVNDVLSKSSAFRGTPFYDHLNEIIMEISSIASESMESWMGISVFLEDHIQFLESNSDLMNEKEAQEKVYKSKLKSRYSLDFLSGLEKEFKNLLDNRNSNDQKISSLEIEKQKLENYLASLNKQKSEVLTKYKAPKDSSENIDYDYNETQKEILIDIESILIQNKIELAKIEIEKTAFQISFTNKENDLIKSRLKLLVVPELNKAKQNLYVETKDIEKIKDDKLKLRQDQQAEYDAANQKILDLRQKINLLDKKVQDNKKKIRINKEKLKSNKDDLEDQKLSLEHFLADVKKLMLSNNHLMLEQEKRIIELKIENLKTNEEFQDFNLNRATIFFYVLRENISKANYHLKEIKSSILVDIKKEIDEISALISKNKSILQDASTTIKSDVKKQKENLDLEKNKSDFKKRSEFTEAEQMISMSENYLDQIVKLTNEYNFGLIEIEKRKKNLVTEYESLKKEAEELMGLKDRWKRSPSAISLQDVYDALADIEDFIVRFFWDTPEKLSPKYIFSAVKEIPKKSFVFILIFLLLFLLTFSILKRLIRVFKERANYELFVYDSGEQPKYLALASSTLSFLHEHFIFIYFWIYFTIFLKIPFEKIGVFYVAPSGYYVSLFYLTSMLVLLNLSYLFIENFRAFNKRMSYFFFSEKSSIKNIILIGTLLSCASIIFPLWFAISSYSNIYYSSTIFAVLIAAYSLLTEIVILLFLEKEDLISLIPSTGAFYSQIRSYLEYLYYPIFLFFIGLLIIFNPYVGYYNLAWYLAAVVPVSLTSLAVGFFFYSYVRQAATPYFLDESIVEGEAIEKFDNARMYYGFLVIATFLAVLFGLFLFLSKIWTGHYNVDLLWRYLSETWTITLGEKERFGLIQILGFLSFIVFGYVFWSLTNKFLLNRLFDIFRVDLGLQNTISKIYLYIVIVISILFGLFAANLGQMFTYAFAAIVFGIGLGIKDQLANFFAGILILLERQIELGHFIETSDIRGTVHRISVRTTTVKTIRNFFISIPNNYLISHPLKNWGAGKFSVGMELRVSIGFDSDVDFACKLLHEIMYEHPLILRVPGIVVRVEEFADSGIMLFTRGYLSARRLRDQWDVASDVRKKLLQEFKKHNITIPYPHRIIHLSKNEKDGRPFEDERVVVEMKKKTES